MIKDLRIHGEIGGDKEFFATLSGEDLDGRYFHETVEKEGELTHRFFAGGSEFLLGRVQAFHITGMMNVMVQLERLFVIIGFQCIVSIG